MERQHNNLWVEKQTSENYKKADKEFHDFLWSGSPTTSDEPTFTDWDNECDLLKEWLDYRIDYAMSNTVTIDLVVLPKFSPKHLLYLLKTTGVMYYDINENFNKPLTFEQWKEKHTPSPEST